MNLLYTNDMTEIKYCCDTAPTVWQCDNFELDCIEKIECSVCGRVIYGTDAESIAEWDNGLSD